jgi:hypothetical protein
MISDDGADTETRYKIHTNQSLKGHSTMTVRCSYLFLGFFWKNKISFFLFLEKKFFFTGKINCLSDLVGQHERSP